MVAPKQGVQYLVDAGLVEYTPEAVARFLKEQGEGLDKVQIGEYFAKGYDDLRSFARFTVGGCG
jgi:hypothetical protein